MELLEKDRQDTVDGVLSRIFQLIHTKDTPFSKDAAFDLVISLKMVAKETKHPKAGYYSAVLQALREKMAVSNEQFRDYISGLLGDKDQEEVFKKLSQVDKASRVRRGRDVSWGNVRPQPYQVRCYYCDRVGHFQRNCYARQRGRGRARGQGPFQ